MGAVNRTTRNVAANFVGQAWNALLALVCFPIYLRLLDNMGAVGLLGVYATLQTALIYFDPGWSTTLNRELARRSLEADSGQAMRNLLRTLEVVCWGLALVVAVVVVMSAPFLAAHWLHSQELTTQTVQRAVALMGVALLFLLPSKLYAGGLLGLQHQVLLSALLFVLIGIRYAGSVLALWWSTGDVTAFFLWHAVAWALQALVLGVALWVSLPGAPARARFDRIQLRGVSRFAAGMGVVSATLLLYTQLDRVILSRFLDAFGYYVTAAMVAATLLCFSEPIFAAVFPRFTQLFVLGEQRALSDLYHGGCQLLAALVLPVTSVVAFFAPELLLLWSRDAGVTERAAPVLRLLMPGMAVYILSRLPYALQLAAGWTRLALAVNVAGIVVLGPLLFVAALRYGAVGAAAAFLGVNAAYTLASVVLMHRRLLPGQRAYWLVQDVGVPLSASLAAAALGRGLLPAGLASAALVAALALVGLAAGAASVLATASTRRLAWQAIAAIATLRGGGGSAPVDALDS
jgi:O-antigen/teichoic acid export membrane protein